MILQPDTLALDGRLRILRLLGEGAISEVYLAEQVSLSRRVALKIFRPELGVQEGIEARLADAARSLASIDHPSVLRVIDFGQSQGLLYLMSEYCEGASLRAALGPGEPLLTDRAVGLLRDVANALAALHEKKLVHGALKPEKILLAGTAPKESARLFDFGVAGLVDQDAAGQRLTVVGRSVGDPRYLSPEQARGAPADARSDLYSFGVLAYEALSGHPPFEGGAPHELIARHLSTPPRPLAEAAPFLAENFRLCELVMRCLEKKAEHRPAADEVARRLAQVPEVGEPTLFLESMQAPEPPPLPRADAPRPSAAPLPVASAVAAPMAPVSAASPPPRAAPSRTPASPAAPAPSSRHQVSPAPPDRPDPRNELLPSIPMPALTLAGVPAASRGEAASPPGPSLTYPGLAPAPGLTPAAPRAEAAPSTPPPSSTRPSLARAADLAQASTNEPSDGAAGSSVPPPERAAWARRLTRPRWLATAAGMIAAAVAAALLSTSDNTVAQVRRLLEEKRPAEALELIERSRHSGSEKRRVQLEALKAAASHLAGQHRTEADLTRALPPGAAEATDPLVVAGLMEDYGPREDAALRTLLRSLPRQPLHDALERFAKEPPSPRQWGALRYLDGEQATGGLDLVALYAVSLESPRCAVRKLAARRLGQLASEKAMPALLRLKYALPESTPERSCGQDEAAAALQAIERRRETR